MRIAYHNPWLRSSENQVFVSMAEAAGRIGVELVACGDEAAIEACRPDFVISVATAMAKITDFPTYLTMHEPKAYLLEQPRRVRNLFSYDGYLTISDSLVRFIKDFCAGVGRSEEPGFYYLTPQASALRADWTRPDPGRSLRVVYFGTNWNRRLPRLFRALDRRGILRIHGPEESWRRDGYASYAGPVAFDGAGPQRIYAECGIGLALMDERWRREDVISNRIFEISSVGAVSICPDMPWTRKWFGDSVFYYDADRPVGEIAAVISAHYGFCKANPTAAKAMGEEARRIFESHFAAERMLANAVAYHERKMAERRRCRAAMAPAPTISVVLRCGGRSIDIVRRAVDSIRRQSFGTFTVIFAKYRDIDLTPLIRESGGAIAEFVEFLISGGNRVEMLFAGLSRVATPYFAILDDDDFWMSDHFEELFRAGRRIREDFDIAFSGSIGFDFPVRYNETQSCNRNILRFGYAPGISDGIDVQNAIGTNCFVARTDLLREEMRELPEMRTAEDSLLICLLAWRSKPIFSWRPTAFYRQDATDGSNWQIDEQRTEDELSLSLRAGLSWAPEWLAGDSFAMLKRSWTEARHKLGGRVSGEYIDRLSVGAAGRRIEQGIAALPGASGHICYGPYINLPPDRYLASFVIERNARSGAARDALGTVEIVADISEILAEGSIAPDVEEVVLPFAIEPGRALAKIEFRVGSSGLAEFTLSSLMLHRDSGAAGGAAMPDVGAVVARAERARVAPGRGRADIGALEAELAAMRASRSWRVTAPLRRLARLARRLRG